MKFIKQSKLLTFHIILFSFFYIQNSFSKDLDKWNDGPYVGLSLGTRLEECKIAANELKNKGISTTIIDARFAKPLDEKLILKSAENHEVLITIEEGSIGGFGSHVANLLAENGIFDKGLKFRSMILPDVFIDQDTPEKMYDVAGLNAKQIAQKVLEVFFSKDGIRVIK